MTLVEVACICAVVVAVWVIVWGAIMVVVELRDRPRPERAVTMSLQRLCAADTMLWTLQRNWWQTFGIVFVILVAAAAASGALVVLN